MGEIADSMINGDFDFHTGEYIGRGYGIPRTLDKSLPWEKMTIKSRKRGKRYKQKEFTDEQKLKGVMFYLYDKGYKDAKDVHKIIALYCVDVLKFEFGGSGKGWVKECSIEIQKDFKSFIKYVTSYR